MAGNVIEIIKQILNEAKKMDTTLGSTKLVKLLYLIDVEYYRYHNQKATNLQWRFYHYGPYALELSTLLQGPDLEIEDIELEGEKLFKKIELKYENDRGVNLDPIINVITNAVVQEWCTKDLNQILNYVYFDTEPMIYAKKGDILDFSTIKKPISVKEVKLNEKKLKEIKVKMQQIIKNKGLTRKPIVREYISKTDQDECLDIWNADKKPPMLSGKFTISLDSLTERDENE
jgi:hypothetical protein